MFIKKDLRKIPRILADAAPLNNSNDDDDDATVHASGSAGEPSSKRPKRDLLTELRLARRQSEFRGSVDILCQPEHAPSLRHLVSLSLYDCQIRSLNGIGMLASTIDGQTCCPNLRELNVGRNPITTLPDELAKLSPSLKELWFDDCQITGPLPDCLFELEHLEKLRVSNNKITSIPSRIIKLKNLEVLCLDRNEIEQVPVELSELCNLQSLLLRNNKLTMLPKGVPGPTMENLSLFHVSSNQLRQLPDSLSQCVSLEMIYANSNHIMTVPKGLGGNVLPLLKRMTLSHNRIESLPPDFEERFGLPEANSGECVKDPAVTMCLAHNPICSE